jgi:hypothetical protein
MNRRFSDFNWRATPADRRTRYRMSEFIQQTRPADSPVPL